MEHHDLAAVNRLQRSAFVLAIFIVVFFMKGQLAAKPLRDARCIVLTALQSKKKRVIVLHASAPLRLIKRPHLAFLPATTAGCSHKHAREVEFYDD
jgi:hypothetical protein